MIDGLKLTFSGAELRQLLDAQVQQHEQRADWWARQRTRTPEDETDNAPVLPDHMCGNEAERHAWRAAVLAFIRDHVQAGETYRLASADLEFGEVLPAKPEWLAQNEYEQRTRVAFTLERLTKTADRLVGMTHGLLRGDNSPHCADVAPQRADTIAETEFRTTRVDLGDGPEIILVERK